MKQRVQKYKEFVTSVIVGIGCFIGLFGAFLCTAGILLNVWSEVFHGIKYGVQNTEPVSYEISKSFLGRMSNVCKDIVGVVLVFMGIVSALLALFFVYGGMCVAFRKDMHIALQNVRKDFHKNFPDTKEEALES